MAMIDTYNQAQRLAEGLIERSIGVYAREKDTRVTFNFVDMSTKQKKSRGQILYDVESHTVLSYQSEGKALELSLIRPFAEYVRAIDGNVISIEYDPIQEATESLENRLDF